MDYRRLLVTIGIFAQALHLAATEIRYASQCFNKSSQLIFRCGEGQMIRIHKLFYGYNPSGHCMFNAEDCVAPDNQHYPCSGKQSCEINLSTSNTGNYLDPCKQYATYYLVSYECIEASQVIDICSAQILTSQRGYISTPNYPLNYHNKAMNCTLTVRMPHKQQKMQIDVIDLNLLPLSPNGTCSDKLYIKTVLWSTTICGPQHNSKLKQYSVEDTQFHFQTTGIGTHKGFLLYFEATPYIEPEIIPTKRTSQRRQTTTSTAAPSNSVMTINTTEKPRPVPANNKQPIQAAAIIGGVIGTLLLLLIVLVILLIVKRRKENIKRIPSSSSRSELYAKPKNSKRGPPLHMHHNICIVHDELIRLGSSDY
ncbi:uncharacterized protein LOC141913275 [Tubulanus polymorphus]|uniref:uncharacterized protein LOC141913275 n=1 Tax=Tubulanus polymorphus TaxID=672921 RepID=UPI003DA6B527